MTSVIDQRTSATPAEEQLPTAAIRVRRAGGTPAWLRVLGHVSVSLAVLIGAGIVWELIARSAGELFFPPISAILENIGTQWLTRDDGSFGLSDAFLSMLGASFARLGPGLLYGAIAGITFGILMAKVLWLYELFFPVFQFLRAIPSSAKIPMFMALLGITDIEKIAVIAVGVALPLMMNVMDGVRGIDPTLLAMAKVYRVSRFDQLWGIVIPSAAPQTIAGLRIATMISLIVLTLAELTGASSGVGYFISYASSNFKPLDMWSGVLLLGVIGYVLNLLLTLVERFALRWQRESLGGGR